MSLNRLKRKSLYAFRRTNPFQEIIGGFKADNLTTIRVFMEDAIGETRERLMTNKSMSNPEYIMLRTDLDLMESCYSELMGELEKELDKS